MIQDYGIPFDLSRIKVYLFFGFSSCLIVRAVNDSVCSQPQVDEPPNESGGLNAFF